MAVPKTINILPVEDLPDPTIAGGNVPLNLVVPVGIQEQVRQMVDAMLNGAIQQEHESEDDDEVDR